MKNILIVTIIFILSCLHLDVNAQSAVEGVISMDVYSIAVTRDTTEEKNPTDSTVFSVFIHLLLEDTLNIDHIIVKLGDKGLPGNRLNHVFKWNELGDAGKGMNYSRNGYNVILSLGNFICFLQYEARIIIKRADGTQFEVVKYS